MLRTVVILVLAAAGLLALLAGRGAFTAVIMLVALAALMDLNGILARAQARPVVPAAALAALGAPVVVLLSEPGRGWPRLPAVMAAGLLAAFLLVLLFGRRSGVVRGVGSTLAVGATSGLGAASLLLLHDLPQGFRLVWGLGALVLIAETATPAFRAAHRLSGRGSQQRLWSDEDDEPADPIALPAVVGGVAVVAVGLTVFAAPPFSPLFAAALAVVAFIAAVGGRHLSTGLALETGTNRDPDSLTLGDGLLLSATVAIGLAAPVAYVVARSLLI